MTFAQERHVCGTSEADQAEMIRYIERFNSGVRHSDGLRDDDTLYFPIQFHLVANNVGEGRVRLIPVLKQFDRIRRDYKAVGMAPYISGEFLHVNNKKIYEDPANNAGTIIPKKVNNAANVFIVNSAQTGSQGTTLGYFQPGGDFMVMRQSEVSNVTSTFSHELGHFFSLPHPFLGWEPEQYNEAKHGNPLTITRHPISNALIELMDGSNCEFAGDRICDTPPDYNFGFGAPSCSFNKIVLDYNKDTIRTMPENYMGYFNGCSEYVFTPMQMELMRDNYFSNGRSYLRRDDAPSFIPMEGVFEFTSPENGHKFDEYNYAVLEWSEVSGASHYAVQLTSSGFAKDTIVTEPYIVLTNLEAKKFYLAEVKPYNLTNASIPSTTLEFLTGDDVSSVIDESILSDLKVMPNPVNSGDAVNVSLHTSEDLDITYRMLDISGREVLSDTRALRSGMNNIRIETYNMESGMYIMQVDSEKGSIQRKVIIR